MNSQITSQPLNQKLLSKFDFIVIVITMRMFHFSLGLLLGASFITSASAQSYSDNFNSGLNKTYWTQASRGSGFNVTTPGGAVQISNSGGFNGGMTENLNMQNALGTSAVSGNFSMSIDLSSVSTPGPGQDAAELQATFGDNTYLYAFRGTDSRDIQGVGFFAPGTSGIYAYASNSVTFTISRVGTTLSAYAGNTLLYSVNDSAALTGIGFNAQQVAGIDGVSSTFDNFTFSAQPAPEPVTMSLGLGMIGVFIKRKLKK